MDMCLGLTTNKEKIGNLMVYLANQIKPIYHTQLIKLFYLIDEEAVKDDGIPITWLDYKAWQYGPVAPETYFIKCGGMEFSDFVEAVRCPASEDRYFIEPKRSFSKDLFSDYEMAIIDRVIARYGHEKPSELVRLTHKEGSLWDITRKENHILFDKEYRISDYSLDFRKLIAHDEEKLERFEGAKEVMMINRYLQADGQV